MREEESSDSVSLQSVSPQHQVTAPQRSSGSTHRSSSALQGSISANIPGSPTSLHSSSSEAPSFPGLQPLNRDNLQLDAISSVTNAIVSDKMSDNTGETDAVAENNFTSHKDLTNKEMDSLNKKLSQNKLSDQDDNNSDLNDLDDFDAEIENELNAMETTLPTGEANRLKVLEAMPKQTDPDLQVKVDWSDLSKSDSGTDKKQDGFVKTKGALILKSKPKPKMEDSDKAQVQETKKLKNERPQGNKNSVTPKSSSSPSDISQSSLGISDKAGELDSWGTSTSDIWESAEDWGGNQDDGWGNDNWDSMETSPLHGNQSPRHGNRNSKVKSPKKPLEKSEKAPEITLPIEHTHSNTTDVKGVNSETPDRTTKSSKPLKPHSVKKSTQSVKKPVSGDLGSEFDIKSIPVKKSARKSSESGDPAAMDFFADMEPVFKTPPSLFGESDQSKTTAKSRKEDQSGASKPGLSFAMVEDTVTEV